MLNHHNSRLQAGATMIEVLIALLVFGIGIQGIISLQYLAVKENFDSTQRSISAWSAQELINRIRSNPEGRAAGNYTIDGNPCADGPPAKSCADTANHDATVCTAEQMAAFDIWQSICSTPNQGFAQNQGTLFNPNLTIACGGACDENAAITLSLQWHAKAVADDADTFPDDDDALKTQQFTQVFQP